MMNKSKPSWDNAPEWARYLAQDHDGIWCWYRTKPFPDEDLYMWMAGNVDFEFATGPRSEMSPRWNETLEARPESENMLD